MIFNRWPDIFQGKQCSAFNLRNFFLVEKIVLLIILFISMIYDLRYREVPASLTLILLGIAAIYALFHGQWILVSFVIFLILISDFKIRPARLAFAVLLLAISAFFDPESVLELFSLFTFWLFWEIGAMGGADSKLMIAILLIIGNALVIFPIAIVGGMQGLVALFRKEKSIPFVVSLFLGTFIFTLVSKIL